MEIGSRSDAFWRKWRKFGVQLVFRTQLFSVRKGSATRGLMSAPKPMKKCKACGQDGVRNSPTAAVSRPGVSHCSASKHQSTFFILAFSSQESTLNYQQKSEVLCKPPTLGPLSCSDIDGDELRTFVSIKSSRASSELMLDQKWLELFLQ